MNNSIRGRLTLIMIFCSIIAALLSTLFVNLAVNSTFNKYVADNQVQRNKRLVEYFQEIYKRDLKWTKNSGKEMQHEGYMSSYCLTLLNKDKKEIWGMNPKDIKYMNVINKNRTTRGEYKTSTFSIKYNNGIVGYIMIGQYQPILISQQDINFKNSINRNIGISVIITMGISILLSMFFSKQFSNPIRAVSDISVDLSKGSYKSISNITKSNVLEINNLIRSINILGNKLKYQDELRKRLVSDISHEIRTPLNILQNNLEAMLDGIFPVTAERLNNLNDEVIRFGKLLNNLDILKEFEDEKVEINFKKVFLNEIINSVFEDFSIHLKDKNIQLHLDVSNEGDYAILGDKDKLRQVFINILSNSEKFTNGGGKISINLRNDKDHVFAMIRDTGIGIKKDDLPFIFERFYRGDKSRHEIEGSGIGLTIVKRILNLHAATIDVESEEGTGTCFTLTFNKIKQ